MWDSNSAADAEKRPFLNGCHQLHQQRQPIDITRAVLSGVPSLQTQDQGN